MGLPLHYGHNPRGELAINVSSAFTGIALVVVVLRLYTRFFLVRYAGIEDYMIIAAMLCSIGLTICIGFRKSFLFFPNYLPSFFIFSDRMVLM
jgi:hypothetical protein